MKRIVLTLLMVLMCSNVQSAETMQVDFLFNQEPSPQSFRMYLDGAVQCEFANPGTGQGSCDIQPLPYGDNRFTMTAVFEDKESPHSPIYVFDKKLNAPTINTVITVSVTVSK